MLLCCSSFFTVGNPVFHFKQFSIVQKTTAMKVCTDSCLFGAYIEPARTASVLDIGTGTSLLSLMLAQRYNTQITAIEIDHAACEEAKLNVQASPWKDKIKVLEADINNYQQLFEGVQFDTIICNPPFYEHQMPSSETRRNVAMHNTHLSFSALAQAVVALLKTSGEAYLLLPAKTSNTVVDTFKVFGLHAQHYCAIKNFAHTAPFRVIIKFGFAPESLGTDTLVIYDAENHYTQRTSALLRPYYLYL